MKYDKEASTRSLFTGQTEPLTFPLTRKFTEDPGDKRSETFLSQGFAKDAAAAYSLRALGAYNEPVVRVRREPHDTCLLYTSPSPRDGLLSRMPSSA